MAESDYKYTIHTRAKWTLSANVLKVEQDWVTLGKEGDETLYRIPIGSVDFIKERP
jgi:hypothetical protein